MTGKIQIRHQEKKYFSNKDSEALIAWGVLQASLIGIS